MRVLMTTMQLDIGGAETHIVELSKALAKRGAEIYVASCGGAYEKELAEAGINHFKVPLNCKNPLAMAKAYSMLKKIISEYKFDVVHGHARIPSFICGKLHKKLHFPFVTTAHWVFRAGFPFNKLSDWGQRSLAVSDDIKQYLIDSYGIDEENIRVTINGIDTEKFSENTDFSDIKTEFSLGDDKKRIVYVSRMDTDRSLVAHHLIQIAPSLYKSYPDLEIVIVGGGNDYNSILKEAEEVNNSVGERLIITTGARTDINKFVASGDIFVGVSRAALEAMACKKPSIIAGNEGYIGIFDEDKLKISVDTNFCCRGCELSTPEHLEQDIRELFDTRDLKKLGEYSREIIKSRYSVETMAEDALKMYASVLTGEKINEITETTPHKLGKYSVPYGKNIKNDVIISGYYGFKNSGDDTSLKAIIGGLKELSPNIRITVLSKTPEETKAIYGVESINRLNIFSIVKKMRQSSLLISGGGSLIQDVTSGKSLIYYLMLIQLATKLKLKTMLYGNGIGPVVNKKSYKRIANVLNKVDAITLREPKSAELLKEMGVDTKKVSITADSVFALSYSDFAEADKTLERIGIGADKKYFCVSVRKWNNLAQDFEESIANTCKYITEKYGFVPIFVPMQYNQDIDICSRILNKLDGNGHILKNNVPFDKMLGIISKSGFVLGMRLHILIYAACTGVPVVGLDYDPKVNNMMEYMGQKYFLPVDTLKQDKLISMCDQIIENRESFKAELEEVRKTSKALADKNAEIAIKLLNGGDIK